MFSTMNNKELFILVEGLMEEDNGYVCNHLVTLQATNAISTHFLPTAR